MSTIDITLSRVELDDLASPAFPNWAREACLAIASRTTNVLIFTGNIDDLVDTPFLQERGAASLPLMPVRAFVELLIEDLSIDRPITETLRISLPLGRFTKGKAPWGPAPAESQQPERELFKTFSDLHKQFERVAPVAGETDLERGSGGGPTSGARSGGHRTLVVLTDVEALAPGYPQATGVWPQSTVDLLALWPRLPAPEDKRVLVTGYAREPGGVVAALRAAGARIVRVPLPGPSDRARFLREQISTLVPNAATDEETLSRLVNVTVGFTLREIQDIAKQIRANTTIPPPPGTNAEPWRVLPQFATDLGNEEMLRHRKSELIVGASQGLLEDVPSQFGFGEVGGLGHVIIELQKIAAHVRAPDGDTRRQLIPRGVLLVGAPGTGKTLIARALARESKMNMVKMRDVRSMWVGESERNLTRVLELVRERRPVVVFVDEIDQAIGRRSTGESRDAGTSERMFGQILEFMGDPVNRGQVIWVAASNRPDNLDSALLSRFDRVIPVLLPDRLGRAEILVAIQRQLRVTFDFEAKTPASADGWHESPWERDADLAAVLDRTDGLSGRALEAIVRRALQVALEDGRELIGKQDLRQAASEYLRNYDESDYELQDLLAVQKCNFTNQLPPVESLASRRHFTDVIVKGSLDREALDKAIQALRLQYS